MTGSTADRGIDKAARARAAKIVRPIYRHLPNLTEFSARLWNDPQLHMRLWTDPALRDACVERIDKALIDAITGAVPMEQIADTLSEIVLTQVEGEMKILGLWDHFWECGPPIKYIVYGLILARMVIMKQRAHASDDDPI